MNRSPTSPLPGYPERPLAYPRAWEDEYQQTMTVAQWSTDFPELATDGALRSTRRGTLDLFAQHALMVLLAKTEGVSSVTWCYLAAVDGPFRRRALAREPWTRPTPARKSKNRARTERIWGVMREHMGDEAFDALQAAVVRAGFTGFRGEPDLFCYAPRGGRWFFAEAKGKDDLLESQVCQEGSTPGWFDVAKATLGDAGVVRVYRLVRAPS